MHEFKHGELKSGRRGKGGKVKSRKQAIAIALHESGLSRYDTKAEKKKSAAKSKRKEATGRTAQQERDRQVARRRPRQTRRTRAMGGKTPRAPPRRASPRLASAPARVKLAAAVAYGSLLRRLLPK